MKKIPSLSLDEEKKAKFYEKIASISLENNVYCFPFLVGHLKSFNLPQKTLEPLISHIMKVHIRDHDANWMGHETTVGFYQKLLKELPTLGLSDTFLEKTILEISHKSIESFIGVLHSLPLKEKILKELISDMIQKDHFHALMSGKRSEFLKDFLSLNIQDKDFVNEALVEISRYSNLELKLKDFPFTDKKTFSQIARNLIFMFSQTDQLDSILKEFITYDIKEKEIILPIARDLLTFHSHKIENQPDLLKRLLKTDSETGLPTFAQILELEDLELRKGLAKNVLQYLANSYSTTQNYPTKFSLSLSLLGLEAPGIMEDILHSVLKEQKVSHNMLSTLYQDPRIGDRITPFFFLDRWDFEAKEQLSKAPPLMENKIQSQEKIIRFFQNSEITQGLTQVPLFKSYLIGALIKLDLNTNIPPLKKLHKLIEYCSLQVVPLPPVEEILGELIFSDISSSNYYNYTRHLEDICSLNIQNPAFFEKAALRLAKKKPEFLIDSIEQFNLSNSQTLEAIGIEILSQDPSLFDKYKLKLNLSKQSVLAIFTGYGAKLHKEGRWTLPPGSINEIFNQITKYRNES
ncbi:MAG: hypothetical protein JSS09_08290, partial [Verrucomicrobia bacterium]|nr:hypothetical protein [Verrucomicrobiota bacterium]